MSTDTEPDIDERAKWSLWAIAAAALLVLLFGVIAVGTLRGCFVVDPEEAAEREDEKKKKDAEKKKKDDFEIWPPVVQPAEAGSPLFVKPGHWSAASQRMRANYRDFVGDLRLAVVNAKNDPYPIAQTPYVLAARRPVLLTRGRPKATDSTFFVPETAKAIRLATQLEERGLGMRLNSASSLSVMPSYQYHFVVLAKESSRYGYLKTLDAVNVPFGGESDVDDLEDTLHYRVVSLIASQSVPLPDNPLTWTSIAYVLWDEVDPQLFTADEQRALVDWLHWGGQLIVSGPDSLDLLKGSFLDAYLPADSAGPRTIGVDDPALDELNEHWLISSLTNRREMLQPTVPWSAVTLDIRDGAAAVPNTGELFAERRVGRGRIVVSAMQLAERDLVNWRTGFDSLFNAVLLRRPPREYRPGYFGDVTLAWADEQYKDRRLDARLTTNLRYLARDLGVDTSYRYEELSDELAGQFNFFGQAAGQQPPLRAYRPPASVGGIGAWNDFNATAGAARTALREAAGVEVPGAGFVVLCLASYLVVLVPLNWLIFHTLGRIEWAWIAAPLIAIVGTVVIVERARLDMGFVRAQTEIALLELQPDHPRAHLSRFTALYTSLSTTYDLEFGNLTTLAAPFSTGSDFRMLRGQGYQSIGFQRYDNVRLVGMPISSNSTGMVRSEQMFVLKGPIRAGQSAALGSRQIENRSQFELHSACIVRRPTRGEASRTGNPRRIEGRWVGQLLPGQSAPMSLSTLDTKKPLFAENRAEQQRLERIERLNLEPMFRLALDPQHIEEGEMRFVARIDEVLPGQSITPAASQVRGATLVVAHLEYAPLPPPRADANSKQDIKTATDQDMN